MPEPKSSPPQVSFRHWHLLSILTQYDPHKGPLDSFIRSYFAHNKALGSKDRRFIGSWLYGIWRYFIPLQELYKLSIGNTNLITTFPLSREFAFSMINLWQERIESPSIFDKKISKLSTATQAGLNSEVFNELKEHYGEPLALEIGRSQFCEAKIFIRANPLKTTREQLLKEIPASWKAKEVVHLNGPNNSELKLDHCIEVDRFNPITAHPLYKEGQFEIQDAGSQWLSQQLVAKPGERVCDFCAGAGGKTLGFAHHLQRKGQIFLHDIREHALKQAKLRLKRAGIENAQIITTPNLLQKRFHNYFDWIFMDAPCSGTGTLRRNPDLRLRLTPEWIGDLIQKNEVIFNQALSLLKPKGRLIYATCSVLPRENEVFINQMQDNSSIHILEKQTLLPSCNNDGFFMCLIEKR